MKEFFEFFQTVGDRLRNRVFGPFFIAFLFWNWKPILLIISSKEPIEITIYEIEACDYFNAFNVLVYPLIISLVYSTIQPFLSYYLGRLIKWPVKKSIESSIEYNKTRKQGEVELAHLDFEIQDAKAGTLQIEDLRKKLENAEKEKDIYSHESNNLRNTLTQLESKNFELENNYQETRSNYSIYLLELIQSRYSDNEKWEVVKALELLGRGDSELKEISNEVKNDLATFKIIELEKKVGNKRFDFYLTPFGQLFITHLFFK